MSIAPKCTCGKSLNGYCNDSIQGCHQLRRFSPNITNMENEFNPELFRVMQDAEASKQSNWEKVEAKLDEVARDYKAGDGYPQTPEMDLILRIVSQWGNAIEMPNMEGWVKEYAEKRQIRKMKKVTASEEIPEFHESLQNMPQEAKQRVDEKLKEISSKCSLTNDKLIAACDKWILKLCETGGKAWSLEVPVNFDRDPDMLFTELTNRFKATPQGIGWVRASEFKYEVGVAYSAKDKASRGAGCFDEEGNFIWGDRTITRSYEQGDLLILDEGQPI